MMGPSSVCFARQLRRESLRRSNGFQWRTAQFLSSRTISSDSRVLPRFTQASTWNAILPKFLRSKSDTPLEPKIKKPRNPANYFIWIYILIGSQAIRIIQTRNELSTYMRKADVKVQKLREVVEALHRGEDVDVEKALGTGDETQEREWEDALKELENEDTLWRTNKQKREDAEREAREKALHNSRQEVDASPVNEDQPASHTSTQTETASEQKKSPPAGFY